MKQEKSMEIKNLQIQLIELKNKKNPRGLKSQKQLSVYKKMIVEKEKLLAQLEGSRQTLDLEHYQSKKIILLQEIIDIYNDIFYLSNR